MDGLIAEIDAVEANYKKELERVVEYHRLVKRKARVDALLLVITGALIALSAWDAHR